MENMFQKTKQLLDYVATQELAIVTYHASTLIQALHSNILLKYARGKKQNGQTFFHVQQCNISPKQWISP